MKQRKKASDRSLIATFRADGGSAMLHPGDQLVVFEREGQLEAHKVPDEIEPCRGYPGPVFKEALRRFIDRHKP